MHEQCLLFLHIPKTGGTSLTTAIRWQYRRVPTARIVRFDALNKPPDEIRRVPLEVRSQAKLVMGHFYYGVHNHIPQKCSYVTLLRDPIARVVSRYRHIVRNPSDHFHDVVTGSNISLEGYARSEFDRNQLDNAQTRQIAGIWPDDPDETTLLTAKANLSSFLTIGLVEKFDESLGLFQILLGWGMPIYLNRNSDPTTTLRVSDLAVELIQERNKLDLELYSYAQERFAQLVAEQGPSFHRRVSTMMAMNRAANFVGARTWPIFRKIVGTGFGTPAQRWRASGTGPAAPRR
jgi:Sulfotransferase family